MAAPGGNWTVDDGRENTQRERENIQINGAPNHKHYHWTVYVFVPKNTSTNVKLEVKPCTAAKSHFLVSILLYVWVDVDVKMSVIV